jgi:electron transfer flavoprotein alpha subunit
MSVLVYTEISKGKVKKASLEAVNYAASIAATLNTSAVAVFVGEASSASDEIGKAGASRIVRISNAGLNHTDAQTMCAAIAAVAQKESANVIVFSHDLTSKAVAPRLSARLKAGFIPGAVDYPKVEGNKMTIRKNVFSGKATADFTIESEVKIISLLPNTFQVKSEGAACSVEDFEVPGLAASRLRIKEQKVSNNELSLPEAELVVSAGRGLKGPENWGIVEELAKELGAATACSRPVSDIGWRPHHEHVGQTGIAIRPNLYIAIGISGAIQHLAGVNGSKTIVVINKDPEAPFFKAADYGIVGDAFEVLPKITEAVKKFKAANH